MSELEANITQSQEVSILILFFHELLCAFNFLLSFFPKTIAIFINLTKNFFLSFPQVIAFVTILNDLVALVSF